MIINQMFYLVFKTPSFSICSLAWCRYCHTSMLHPGFCPILRAPYHRSHRLLPSQRPMLLWTACSKLRLRKLRREKSIVLRIVCNVRACEYSTSTFDIQARAWLVDWELHPLLPGEQLVQWAKLNRWNFCAITKYEHWAKFLSSENFVLYGTQQKAVPVSVIGDTKVTSNVLQGMHYYVHWSIVWWLLIRNLFLHIYMWLQSN